jgi:hypothetical protein
MHAGATSYPAFSYLFDGPIHLTSVQCDGTESQLLSCPYNNSFYDILFFCDHFFDIVVRCQRGTEIDSVVEYSKYNPCILAAY